MPTDVNVVDLSGPALDWLKFAIIAHLAIGVVGLVLLAAIAVSTLWGGRR